MRLKRETGDAAGAGRPTGAEAARTVQCPLCGARFDPAESPACAYCPRLLRGCGMAACPRCFHEFPVFS